ncbi:hypothetical protein [Aeromicrobium sp. CF3.5]|uniref:hypothetical protein n=1 Tax=Aeromicrobium sp. CF3.5 TaxID=3373078 RepID=UPI003EE75B2A
MVTGHLDHVFSGSSDVTGYLLQVGGRVAGAWDLGLDVLLTPDHGDVSIRISTQPTAGWDAARKDRQ